MTGVDIGRINQQSYNDRDYNRPSYTPLYSPEIVILLKHYEKIKGKRVLDAGCGQGRATPFLELVAGSYVGFDYASKAIETALRHCPDSDLRVMDARDLSALDQGGAFQFVLFLHNGIDYVGHDDRIAILRQLNRLMEPGATFVFSSHNLEDLRTRKKRRPRLGFSLDPGRFINKFKKWRVKTSNYNRIAEHQHEDKRYAIVADGGFDFSLLTYYLDRAYQKEQLEDGGFELLEMYDTNGRQMGMNDPSEGFSWIHYVARKVKDV